MAKVTNLVRRMFGKDALHLKLRRAVAQRKPRQIAELLEQGASPVFRSAQDKPQQINALLLACQQGDAHIVNLLLDWFFHQRALLSHWGPQMYCMTIRSGHWKAFLRLHQRNVPQHVHDRETSRIPAPIFIAAESGQHQILSFLISQSAPEWRSYEFGGHSLLSIASRHGHYECVEVLLANMIPTVDMMDLAVDCARKHRQAHVLVLLTSCLPEYNSNPSQVYKPSYNLSSDRSSQDLSRCSLDDFAMLQRQRGHHRGSLAETEVMSEYDEHDLERRSSAWGTQRYSDEQDLQLSSDYGMPFSNDSDEAAYQRYNPNRQTMDGFALLQAAREADARKKERMASTGEAEPRDFENRQRSSGELTWDSSSSSPPVSSEEDEERWYAMKSTDELIHPYIKSNTSSCSSSSTDPFTDFDGTFHAAAEEQVASWRFTKKRQQQQPEPKRERELVMALPPSPISQPQKSQSMQPLPPISGSLVHVPTPPVSYKLISIRSNNFRSYRTLPSIKEERSPAVEQD